MKFSSNVFADFGYWSKAAIRNNKVRQIFSLKVCKIYKYNQLIFTLILSKPIVPAVEPETFLTL